LTDYLSSIKKQFEYYRLLGDKVFIQVPEKQLFWQVNEESNSIATIVKHLHGNMMSRWTDFLTSDGEKDWRTRDKEFLNEIDQKETLLKLWNEGWNCLLKSIDALTIEDLKKEIYIRNMGHTVVEAINRQLTHYAYHVGQIVFLGKLIQDNSWETLSIAKGGSNAYNADKFSKDKRSIHFTEDL